MKKHNIAKTTASSKHKLTEKALMIDSQPHVAPSPPKKPRYSSTTKKGKKRGRTASGSVPPLKPTPLSLQPSPKRAKLSANSSLENAGLEYISTTYQQLGENIYLPLPTVEWKLDAIQILIAYSDRTVRNNLSMPAWVRPVCCDEIAPHICDRVLGDGSCLFHAISKEITGTEGNHIVVRHAVLQYLRQNPSLINYADPTFNMTMCTDPVRKAQLQQEAVSRYITTHHIDDRILDKEVYGDR